MHSKGKVVSLAVPAIGKRYKEWVGNPLVFDYSVLTTALKVDQLHVMAYDFHQFDVPEMSGHIGSVAPLVWVRDVCDYITASGQQDRCSLGLPMYGIRTPAQGDNAGPVWPNGLLDQLINPDIEDFHLKVCDRNQMYDPETGKNYGLIYTDVHELNAPHGVQKSLPTVLDLFASELIVLLAALNAKLGGNVPNVPSVAEALVMLTAAKNAFDQAPSFTWYFDTLDSLLDKVKAAKAAKLLGITYWVVGDEPLGFFDAMAKAFGP